MYNIARSDIRKFLSVSHATDTSLPWGDEPTYLSFNYKFHFVPLEGNIDVNDTGQFEGSGLSNLLLPDSNINSATNYLRRINRPEQADMLEEFRNQLESIQKDRPWTFTTVNGLDGLMMTNPNLHYMEADKSISLEYNETLDMQMLYLIKLYQDATFDYDMRRYLLPENMQCFDMEIVVTEMRDMYDVNSQAQFGENLLTSGNTPHWLQNTEGWISDKISTGKDWINADISGVGSIVKSSEYGFFNDVIQKNTPQWAKDYVIPVLNNQTKQTLDYYSMQDKLTYTIFTLERCKFNFDSFSAYSGLTNTSNDSFATGEITIKVGKCWIRSEFGSRGVALDNVYEDSSGALASANNSVMPSGRYEGHNWSGTLIGGNRASSDIDQEQPIPTPPGGSLISGLVNDALDKAGGMAGEMLGEQVGDILGANIANLGSSIAKKEFKKAIRTVGDAIEQMVSGMTLNDIPPLKPTGIKEVTMDDSWKDIMLQKTFEEKDNIEDVISKFNIEGVVENADITDAHELIPEGVGIVTGAAANLVDDNPVSKEKIDHSFQANVLDGIKPEWTPEATNIPDLTPQTVEEATGLSDLEPNGAEENITIQNVVLPEPSENLDLQDISHEGVGEATDITDVSPDGVGENTDITDINPAGENENTDIADVNPDGAGENTDIADINPDGENENLDLQNITPETTNENNEINNITPETFAEADNISDITSDGTGENTESEMKLTIESAGESTMQLTKMTSTGAVENTGLGNLTPEGETENNVINDLTLEVSNEATDIGNLTPDNVIESVDIPNITPETVTENEGVSNLTPEGVAENTTLQNLTVERKSENTEINNLTPEYTEDQKL